MCGIAGYINLDGRPLIRETDAPLLTAMGAAIHHRGPDDTRLLLWENVGFVFKRLSIVDIAGGAQPLDAAEGRISAMINGEIYNHRDIRADLAHRHAFRTRSDCEVVPYLYLERGLDLFAPVNGMYAVALLDRQERRVLLARDRMGIKPLFYCIADGGRVLVFASELKGLFAHPLVPRVFDWHAALADASASRADSCEYPSGFKGIERVPAAGIVDIGLDRRSVGVRRYWMLPARDASPACHPISHYVDGYRALLESSVKLRLMSDVGYGLFLSGGIDSSMVAAIAARAGPFPTFSILSPSTAGSGDAHSAHEVASALALPNHQVLFDESSIAVSPDHWRRVLWACELHTLTAEQLFKFNLHAFARRRYPGLKVMLLGQGSDEFNGGYIAWVLNREGPWHAGDWSAMGERLGRERGEAAAANAGIGATWLDLFGGGVLTDDFAMDTARRPGNDSVWDRYTAHFRRNLDYHLWHEDRTSASHAIENRVPFLDHRLLEFTAQVPEDLHTELFVDKRILRRAARGLLSSQHAERPKGYLFYGKEQARAFRMMYDLLQRNDGELVEQAIAGSARTGGPLDAAHFRAHAADVGRDPAGAGVTRLLWLVNMGVLADMADRGVSAAALSDELPVSEVSYMDWSRPADAGPMPGAAEIDGDIVVRLAMGVEVFDVDRSQEGGSGRSVRVVSGGRTDVIDSPMWSQFLLQVDGVKTLRQIIRAGHLNASGVRKHVRRALTEGVLEICAPGNLAAVAIGAMPATGARAPSLSTPVGDEDTLLLPR